MYVPKIGNERSLIRRCALNAFILFIKWAVSLKKYLYLLPTFISLRSTLFSSYHPQIICHTRIPRIFIMPTNNILAYAD